MFPSCGGSSVTNLWIDWIELIYPFSRANVLPSAQGVEERRANL